MPHVYWGALIAAGTVVVCAVWAGIDWVLNGSR